MSKTSRVCHKSFALKFPLKKVRWLEGHLACWRSTLTRQVDSDGCAYNTVTLEQIIGASRVAHFRNRTAV
eukprot:2663903-Pyramimonas_sp.AAC.1